MIAGFTPFTVTAPPKGIMTKHKLIALMVIAQALDLVTTVVNIRLFGFVEVNPVTAGVSLSTFAIVKIVLTVLSVFVMLKLPLPKWFYHVACVLSAIPGVWNVTMMTAEWIYRYA